MKNPECLKTGTLYQFVERALAKATEFLRRGAGQPSEIVFRRGDFPAGERVFFDYVQSAARPGDYRRPVLQVSDRDEGNNGPH